MQRFAHLFARPGVVATHDPGDARQNRGTGKIVVGGHRPIQRVGEGVGSQQERVGRPVHRDGIGGPGHGRKIHGVHRTERGVAGHPSQRVHGHAGVCGQQAAVEAGKPRRTKGKGRRASVLWGPEKPNRGPATITGMGRLAVLLGCVEIVESGEVAAAAKKVGELVELVGRAGRVSDLECAAEAVILRSRGLRPTLRGQPQSHED